MTERRALILEYLWVVFFHFKTNCFKIIHFWIDLAYYTTYLDFCLPNVARRAFFCFNLWAAETFYFSMQPVNSFEFETPALDVSGLVIDIFKYLCFEYKALNDRHLKLK